MKTLLALFLCLSFTACATEEPTWKMQDELKADVPPPEIRPEIAPKDQGCLDKDGYPTPCPHKKPKKKKKKKSSSSKIETLPVDEGDSLARFNQKPFKGVTENE